MRISVIIPTYNRASTVFRAIDSVLMQSQSDLIESVDIVVVDDGSSDATMDLIQTYYPQLNYLYQANMGVSAARNKGIEYAFVELGSTWIALLDSDDEWLPNKLVDQAEMLHKSGLQVCHTEEIWVRNGVRVNQMKKHQKRGGWIFQYCLPLCAMSPSSILLSKRVFEEVGVFNVNLPACEDYDLWLRISAAHEVAYLPSACIIKYGGHEDQLSRQFWGMDRFRVIALENILSKASLVQDQSEQAKAMLIKKLTILQKGAHKHQNHDLFDECVDKLTRWQ